MYAVAQVQKTKQTYRQSWRERNVPISNNGFGKPTLAVFIHSSLLHFGYLTLAVFPVRLFSSAQGKYTWVMTEVNKSHRKCQKSGALLEKKCKKICTEGTMN